MNEITKKKSVINEKLVLNKIMKVSFILIAVILAIMMLMLGVTHNEISDKRTTSNLRLLDNVKYELIDSSTSPTGFITVYELDIENIEYSDMLAFYVNHHKIKVYIDSDCVYSLNPNSKRFKTTGDTWALISLYEKDTGKTIRVEYWNF